jgi:hypothetical protein
MWVRVSGLPTKKIILYDYASSRSGKIAVDLLADYQEYLQTDDFAGYHALGYTSDIIRLGCWAHARRKFIEAQKAATPKGKKAKAGKACGIASSFAPDLHACVDHIESCISPRFQIVELTSSGQTSTQKWFNVECNSTPLAPVVAQHRDSVTVVFDNGSKLTDMLAVEVDALTKIEGHLSTCACIASSILRCWTTRWLSCSSSS